MLLVRMFDDDMLGIFQCDLLQESIRYFHQFLVPGIFTMRITQHRMIDRVFFYLIRPGLLGLEILGHQPKIMLPYPFYFKNLRPFQVLTDIEAALTEGLSRNERLTDHVLIV